MHKYALFHFVKDVRRDEKVPVGVVLWSEADNCVAMRFPRAGERVPDIARRESHDIVSAVEERLLQWQEEGGLPYYPEVDTPCSDAWWRAVADLLHHAVQIGDFHPVSLRYEPEEEVESLFECLVRPQHEAEPVVRIDGKVTEALTRRRLQHVYLARQELPGAYGTPVRVMRAYRQGDHVAIVEGVSLRVADPHHEVDEFVGRVNRLRGNGMDTSMAVGVLMHSGPEEGDAALKEYLAERVCVAGRDALFDLDREQDEFAEYAGQIVERVKRAVRLQRPLPGVQAAAVEE